MDKPTGELGRLLKRWREAAGLTQEALAERTGLSAQAIGALETGKRRHPYPATVAALAAALALTPAERALLVRVAARRPAMPAAAAGSLPRPATPLVGREPELAPLAAALAGRRHRLLTMTGPGGVGKTRLAVALAAEAGGAFPDGVAFVDLAPLADPAGVSPTIARALGAAPADARPADEALRTVLRDRALLLILDNLEHLLGCAPELAALLDAAPGVTVLATSRAPLGLRAEQVYAVRPLALPGETEPGRSAAERLFLERARAAEPGFTPTPAGVAAVAEICRRLDGLPLALELAAPWLRLLTPAELLARLDRALPLLTGGPRDLPARQQTMRAAIAWSLDLLEPGERALFRELAAFVGGWDLAAMDAVTSAGSGALPRLARLAEHGLVTAERHGEEASRFRFLEPVGEYARELLEQDAGADEVRGRHARRFLAFAAEAAAGVRGREQARWLARLETEHANLRAALGWLLERGDAAEAARLAWALWFFWWSHGHYDEGRRWAERILASGPLPPVAEARARHVLAVMRYRLEGPEQPARLFRESAELFHRAGEPAGVALARGGLALALVRAGEIDRGESLLAESIAALRDLGDAWSAAQLLIYLGVIPFNRGRHTRALEHFAEALALARRLGNPFLVAFAAYDVGLAEHALGRFERARERYAEALRIGREIGDVLVEASCLEGLAGIAGALGDPIRAARLYGASRARLAAIGVPPDARATDPAFLRRCLEQARAGASPAAWDAAWAEGAAMSPARANAYALAEAAATTVLSTGQTGRATGDPRR